MAAVGSPPTVRPTTGSDAKNQSVIGIELDRHKRLDVTGHFVATTVLVTGAPSRIAKTVAAPLAESMVRYGGSWQADRPTNLVASLRLVARAAPLCGVAAANVFHSCARNRVDPGVVLNELGQAVTAVMENLNATQADLPIRHAGAASLASTRLYA
jgi:hypothetical protein